MSVFGFIGHGFKRAATAVSDLLNPRKWLVDYLGGIRTTSGESVTPQSALQLAVYFACLRNISEDVGKLPFVLYELDKTGKTKTRARDHVVYRLIHTAPNPNMGALNFRETMTHYAAGWGRGIAEIVRSGSGAPEALYPIHPGRTSLIRNAQGEMLVKVQSSFTLNGNIATETRYLAPQNYFHLRPLSTDGEVGYSVAGLARESIGLGLAAQKFGASFFGNGATPGGVLKHKGILDDKAYERLRKSWENTHGGAGNSNKPAILEEGMEWEKISIPPEDAQFIETQQFNVEDICRWFRMPPHKVQHLLRSTFSNIEAQNIEYVTDTLLSWCVRWEQEANTKLLLPSEENRFTCEHIVEGLLRGDSASRAAFYKAMFEMGAYSPNDIRERENLNPIKGGDKYFVQLNLTTLENAGQPKPVESKITVAPPAKEESPQPTNRLGEALALAVELKNGNGKHP